MDKRILIIGTSPYDVNTPARAFDSYFHFYNRELLVQFFSAPLIPKRGHCSSLYRITDYDILKKWLGSKDTKGKIFEQALISDSDISKPESKPSIVSKLYSIGHNKNSLLYLLRGILWRKKFWCEKELLEWADSFRPDCIFLAFSDDYFLLRIACYFSERYRIPIVSCIGDDYYFNYSFSLSPLYHIYKLSYRHLVRNVFKKPGSAIYIGNKIRDKYNSAFNLNGETVYLASQIERREFRPINKDNPRICYFGNIRLGRNKSLSDIANALHNINPAYRIDVYTNETDEKYLSVLKNNASCIVHGSIPYESVLDETSKSDLLLVVEGFKKKDVDISRYSLSTKVADSLASGVCVFAYGSLDCGAISYSLETGAISTCLSHSELTRELSRILFDIELQKQHYAKAIEVCKNNHTLINSCNIFENVIAETVAGER